MGKYKISNDAKDDLVRIHHYVVNAFGEAQADKYFNAFFDYFELIAQRPYSIESVDYIKTGYRRFVCGSDCIYYRVTENIVEIMVIIGRQDLNSVL